MGQGLLAPETKPSEHKIFAGEIALDGSNPTPVQTPFKTILGVALALKGTSAPGDNTSVLTYDAPAASPGLVNIYAWKNTSGTDPTLVASTGTETVSYVVMGY